MYIRLRSVLLSVAAMLGLWHCGESNQVQNEKKTSEVRDHTPDLGKPFEVNKIYKANERILHAKYGISILIPENYQAQLGGANQPLFLTGIPENPNLEKITFTIDEGQLSTVQDEFKKPQTINSSLTVVPNGAATTQENTVFGNFINKEANIHVFLAVKVGPYGYFAVVGIAERQRVSDHGQATAKLLLENIIFTKPNTPEPIETKFDLVGKKLSYYKTDTTGYSENEHIWLCNDGRFHQQFSSYSAGSTSGHYSSHSQGRYLIDGTNLTLSDSSSGQNSIYQLSYQDHKLFANNRRYYISSNQRCP